MSLLTLDGRGLNPSELLDRVLSLLLPEKLTLDKLLLSLASIAISVILRMLCCALCWRHARYKEKLTTVMLCIRIFHLASSLSYY